ncbi:hypothetical protein CHGG_03632 [Chaetomium globosum CBS 148.51]|uniref:UDP-glucoronosyl and UDP-glucosyl transferase family protein n=1 Tax=Chaetomium globosum (strain ATCC 6205 / CBS 148.51 / DSM 1962 / NBRC 6347 / NRRL 1970) TaxID=306901 RepID=Q2H822_CHAGB|nr:uncharacterized protein CHGG_03632 [Chaetomium globosum CBS 148.51]EAQ91697.1 hypothetical protein CHGG_03632 [Chaetomium globosum CBS 148.51]
MKKVLLAVNAEYGQANVFLAVGHALQAMDPEVRIHFVSFNEISKDVSSASEYSVKSTPGAQPWKLHLLDGPAFMKAIAIHEGNNKLEDTLEKRPSFSSILEMSSKFMSLLLPWDGPEFVAIYKSFLRIVDEVQPDQIVLDSLFAPGTTACQHLNMDYIVFSPNTLKDFAVALQPRGAMFWKFPVMGSAFPFPVPATSIPANIFYSLTQIYYAVTDRRTKAVAAHVKKAVGADLVTFQHLMMRPPKDRKILVSNRPEIEFPLAVVPKHLTPCGPVIRPVPPVTEVDGELDAWLRRGPTVFVCLGTHRNMEEWEALEMAEVILRLLEAAEGEKGDVGGVRGKVQVLWKLKRTVLGGAAPYETGPGTKVYEALKNEIEADRVRIVDWVKPQPSAILQVKSVVLSINHGGANSFHDALTAEYLGIGLWGNKQAMPRSKAQELAPIVIDAVIGPKAEQLRGKVRQLAALCDETPGVSVAASAILEGMGGKKE